MSDSDMRADILSWQNDDNDVCAEILSWQNDDRQWWVCWDTELIEWRQTVTCVLRCWADRVTTDSDVCAEILSWQTVMFVLRYWADRVMSDSDMRADILSWQDDVCAEILSWQIDDRLWHVCWDTEVTQWQQTVTGYSEVVDSKCSHFSAIGCLELSSIIQKFTLFQLLLPPHITLDGCDEALPETYST